MHQEAILGLIAERLAAADWVEDVEHDRGRLVIIDNEGAAYRIEANLEGYVEKRRRRKKHA